jgi:hypothetical protein
VPLLPPEEETSPDRKKEILVQYMLLKVELEDWHGVADVANDIRELEARFPHLKAGHQPG